MKSEPNIDQNDDFDFYGDTSTSQKDMDNSFKTIETSIVKDDVLDKMEKENKESIDKDD